MLMTAFSLIFENSANAVPEPVLQCVQIKPLAGQQGTAERFRVVLSDIDNFVQCMLATRMFTVTQPSLGPPVWLATDKSPEVCHVVHEGKLRKGCFVRLKSFQANEVKGKKYGPQYGSD